MSRPSIWGANVHEAFNPMRSVGAPPLFGAPVLNSRPSTESNKRRRAFASPREFCCNSEAARERAGEGQ
jgi:hypothetical protein